MEPSATQVASEKAAQNASERIRTRTANGEFGTPPDINLVHQAWEDLLANEVRGRGRRPIYHDVCGLWHDLGWTNDANRVLLSGVARESITIPEGVKVLVLKNNPEPGSRQPNAKILYVTHED